jgi:hypothetical protein
VQPGPGPQVELLAVNGEAKCPGEDLNHRSAGCLMLGEFFVGVEAEHGDIYPVTPVYDLGDNGTGLDGHLAGGICDQRMGHSSIIVRTELTRHSRAADMSASRPQHPRIFGGRSNGVPMKASEAMKKAFHCHIGKTAGHGVRAAVRTTGVG